MNPETVARGLGFLSVGLGATELVASKAIAKFLGLEDKEQLLEMFGARDVASGVACLSMNPPKVGIWSRIVGDVLDIAVLAAHMCRSNPKRANVGMALGAVLGITVADAVTAVWLDEDRNGPFTRFVRGKVERMEHINEDKMREVERQGGQFASPLAAHAGS